MENKMIESKSIILGAPENFSIADKISFKLSCLGFDVQECMVSPQPFQYKNIGQRLYNLYRKVVFNDYEHKKQLKAEANKQYYLDKINTFKKADYALIIRPDLYPEDVLLEMRKKVDLMVAYQWDGFDRFPNVKELVPVFDRFYVFDPADLKYEGVLPTTNFYLESRFGTDCSKNKVFYVGSYDEARWEITCELLASFADIDINKEILLFPNKGKIRAITEEYKEVSLLDTTIPYRETLNKVKDSSVLLDLQNPIHKGLSFRVFEGLGFNKKVITTNPAVEKYDFYNPNNILIWENQHKNEVLDFINSPYEEVPSFIREKYSFENWIKYVLNIEKHTPIQTQAMQMAEA
ncbi:MAG TPA: hypothetical protein VK102_04045 [Sphingobacterium sp.]|nr:hypothetical protein [Sphingobacterium sp.]